MAIEITKIINKHMAGRSDNHIPLCINWLYDQIGGKRKPGVATTGLWCGIGWHVSEYKDRYTLECWDIKAEQRFSLIWL